MNQKHVVGVLLALLLSFCILAPVVSIDTDHNDSPTLSNESLPDGTVLSDDHKTLITAPSNAVNYVIPDTVEIVSGYAFFKCSKMQSITFPESVKTLEPHTFDGLGLITVYVPAGCTYMSSIPPFFTIIEVGGEPATHTVTFNSNGGSSVASQTVEDGSTATKPSDPTKSGFVFAGWYSDSALTTVYNFNLTINADLTLHAKWVEELVFTSIPTADMIVKQTALNTFSFTPKVEHASVVKWDFGDGNSLTASSTDEVTHTYGKAGTYTVKLTASNSEGSTTAEQNVTAGEDNDLSIIDKLKDNPALLMIIIGIVAIVILGIWRYLNG